GGCQPPSQLISQQYKKCPSCDLVDTGLSGLALCLFGGDIPEGRMEPLTIVVSFDVGEQVVPGGIAGFVASLVHEFSFPSVRVLATQCTRQTPSRSQRSLSDVSTISREGHTSISSRAISSPPRSTRSWARCGSSMGRRSGKNMWPIRFPTLEGRTPCPPFSRA